MKDYEDEAFDDIERAQQRKVATGMTDGSGWRKRQIAEQGESVQDDYKAWYEEAMAASNEAGYVGFSAAETIRELDKIVSTPPAAPVQEPVAFKIYKPTPPQGAIPNVRDAELPWVYDQDPSSGNVASMWVTPVQALRSKK